MKLVERIDRVKRWISDDLFLEWDNEKLLWEETNKPFYVVCWWGSGYDGNFSTYQEIEDCVHQDVTAQDDEHFDIMIYDVDRDFQLDYEIETKIKLKKME